MIKNYKTFLNIILSLSLILIPSYGYSQTSDSEDVREKYLGHIAFNPTDMTSDDQSETVSQDLDFPPEFKQEYGRNLDKIMESAKRGELRSYLDQTTPQSLSIFALLYVIHSLQDGYLQSNDSKNLKIPYVENLFQHIESQNPNFVLPPKLEEVKRTFEEIIKAVADGRLRDYINEHSALRPHFNTLYSETPDFNEFSELLMNIGKSMGKDNLEEYLEKNKGRRFLFLLFRSLRKIDMNRTDGDKANEENNLRSKISNKEFYKKLVKQQEFIDNSVLTVALMTFGTSILAFLANAIADADAFSQMPPLKYALGLLTGILIYNSLNTWRSEVLSLPAAQKKDVSTEMESKPPGLLKRAWNETRNACAGLFTKSNNKKDNDTSS